MKVIGAGLPRTATLTQKISLEMLGFGPCYHMVNVLADLSLAPKWAAAFDGNADWDAIFGGSQASVDWPGSFFWRELIEYYPDAKVLLSVRSGEAWANSMKNTIWGVFYDDVLMRHLSDARAHDRPGLARVHRAHEGDVAEERPARRDDRRLRPGYSRCRDGAAQPGGAGRRSGRPAARVVTRRRLGAARASSSTFRCRRPRSRTSTTRPRSRAGSSTAALGGSERMAGQQQAEAAAK